MRIILEILWVNFDNDNNDTIIHNTTLSADHVLAVEAAQVTSSPVCRGFAECRPSLLQHDVLAFDEESSMVPESNNTRTHAQLLYHHHQK